MDATSREPENPLTGAYRVRAVYGAPYTRREGFNAARRDHGRTPGATGEGSAARHIMARARRAGILSVRAGVQACVCVWAQVRAGVGAGACGRAGVCVGVRASAPARIKN